MTTKQPNWKEIVVKVFQAQALVNEDIHEEGMDVSDIDEADYIDMIVDKVKLV